jgi:hypothetical protein
MSKTGVEKSGRFEIFLVDFCLYGVEKWPIRIYRKTGPTKSTVLGPRPPPWRKHDFYRFLVKFHDFGAFNRAGKTVSKIGIYSKPPPKKRIYSIFISWGSTFRFLQHFLVNFFASGIVFYSPSFGISIVLALEFFCFW